MKTAVDPELQRDVERLVHREHHDPHSLLGAHAGEGGMVVFRDAEAAEKARLLRSHGMTTLSWQRHQGHAASYDVVALGFNFRIDEARC